MKMKMNRQAWTGMSSAALILGGFLSARLLNPLLGYGLIALGGGALLATARETRPAWWPWLLAGLVPALVLLAWVLPRP